MQTISHSFRVYLGGLALLCIGCSCEFNPNTPQPGEQNRIDQIQKGDYGAESIEDLRQMYLKAHQAKDMNQFRHMLGWNVGRLNRDHSRPWYTGNTPPTELAMVKIFNIPIKDVEFLAGPGPIPGTRYGTQASFYRHRKGQSKQSTGIVADVYGRFILIAEDGRRIDPFYVVLDYYGRYMVSTEAIVVEDAYDSYQKKRPPIWLPVPMDPQPPEEKALFKEVMHYELSR